MMPTDHFMQVNNRKYRNWDEDAEPRQCAIYQDEQERERSDDEEAND